MISILIEGRIFEIQGFGGISRIYHEILPKICDLDEKIRFSLITASQLQQAVPRHFHIQHSRLSYWEKILRPGRYFQQARKRGRIRAQKTWWRNNRADIWHSTYYALPCGWQGPVVISAYDLIYERFPEIFNRAADDHIRAQMYTAVKAADVIVCISQTTKKDFVDFYGLDPAKIKVTYLGVSSAFRRLPPASVSGLRDRPFLFYVGRRRGYKNFSMLVSAYSRWPKRKSIDLLVVGSPWSREEVQMLNELGISGKVHLKTDINDEALAKMYNEAAVFVFPSLYEGFGLPLLEAMACGCPVVASDIPTNIELAKDAATFFKPEEAEDLLRALDQALLEGPAAEKVQRGIELASSYSWDKSARETLEIYHDLV